MEEKDSRVSGSFSLSDNDSPPTPLSVPSFLGGAGSAPPSVNTVVNTGMSLAIPAVSGNGGGSGDLTAKKKRGRPRKYDADGNLRVPYLSQSPHGFTLTSSKSAYSSSKKNRPSGSGNWQLLASLGELFTNTAGGDFTPHVVTVGKGEDVASKIMSFSQKGPRGICVLSANGTVSNVTINQAGSSGGILTYEGRFEIISLTGSFTVSEKDGMRSRSGGLSVSLAGPDGRVIGGSVAGLLMADSPIQIVVGSFMPNAHTKPLKKKHQYEPPRPENDQETITAATPISQAAPAAATTTTTANFFSAVPPIPTNHFLVKSSHGDGDAGNSNIPNGIQNLNNVVVEDDWKMRPNKNTSRPSPDINLPVQVELN